MHTPTPDDVRVLRDGFTHHWAPRDGSDSIDSNTGFGAPTRVDPDAQEPVIYVTLHNAGKIIVLESYILFH